MQMQKTILRGPAKARRGLARMLIIACLPIALAGCEHDRVGPQVAGWQLIDPEQRHPILVSQQPAVLNLHVAAGSEGLTPSQRSRVIDFIDRHRASDAGNSRFVISAPAGSSNEAAAMDAASDTRRLILGGGYADSSIANEAYHAGGRDAPLRTSHPTDPPPSDRSSSRSPRIGSCPGTHGNARAAQVPPTTELTPAKTGADPRPLRATWLVCPDLSPVCLTGFPACSSRPECCHPDRPPSRTGEARRQRSNAFASWPPGRQAGRCPACSKATAVPAAN